MNTSPDKKKPKLTSLEKSESSLVNKLTKLKAWGVLAHSVRPADNSSDFELLEFYGDSYLGERIAHFLLKTKRFLNPNMLTKFKAACVCNANLQRCYDKLNLEMLMDTRVKPKLKSKADVVEAVIGELAEAQISSEHSLYISELRSALDGLISYISFNGEQSLYQQAIEPSSDFSRSPDRNESKVSPTKKKPDSPPRKVKTPKRVTFADAPIVHPIKTNFPPAMTNIPIVNSRRDSARGTAPTKFSGPVTILQRPIVNNTNSVPTPHRSISEDQFLRTSTTTVVPEASTWQELLAWANGSEKITPMPMISSALSCSG